MFIFVVYVILKKMEGEDLNLLNREIINKVANSKKIINLEEIQKLINMGADLNESDELFENFGGFYCECLDECDSNINTLPLLKLFVKNGFNIDKFASNILQDYRFFDRERKDVVEVAKYILNTCKNKVNVEDALEAISIETSNKNCSEKNDFGSNLLYILYEVLDRYKNNKNFDDISDLTTIKGQKIIDVSIDGQLEKYDKNVVFVNEKNNDTSMKITIKCDKNTLVVYNTDFVMVDNGAKCEKDKNPFVSMLKKEIVGEKIENIVFEHFSCEQEERVYLQGRNSTIILSNGKTIILKTIYDKNCYGIKYAKINKNDILVAYPSVFVEKELNILEKNSLVVVPDMSAKLKIFHNCDVNWGARLSFYLVERNFDGPELFKEDEEFITIDIESFEVIRPYIEKYVLNFDEYDEINPIKSETYASIEKEIKQLISDLEKNNYSKAYQQCEKNVCGWIEETYGENGGFNEIKTQLINFLKAFVWYFGEHKKFGRYDGDYRLINIVGY